MPIARGLGIIKVLPLAVAASIFVLPGCSGILQKPLSEVFGRGPDSGTMAADAFSVGDFSTASALWTSLANRGDSIAQFSLGFMLEEGNGTPVDNQGAARWYRLSADQGYSSAQYNLGRLYQEGLGLPRDTLLAAQWYVLAARQGDALAQFSLGFLYVNDPTVTCASVIPRDCVAMFGEDPDPALGAIWYRLAAEQGVSEAQNNLGTLYGAGVGLPQDDAESYAWFSVAAGQGNDAAIANRDLAASRMTPEALGAAQQLAQSYRILYATQN